MLRLVIIIFCILQTCSNAFASSLGEVLNEKFSIPTYSKPAKPIRSAPVDKQQHGDDWPFTVEAGVIGCEDGLYPYFKAKGHIYKLTEMTKPNYESVAPIWRDNPNKAGSKYSLLIFIDAALGFCDLS